MEQMVCQCAHRFTRLFAKHAWGDTEIGSGSSMCVLVKRKL